MGTTATAARVAASSKEEWWRVEINMVDKLSISSDTIGDGAVRASQTANRVGRFWRVTGTKTKDTTSSMYVLSGPGVRGPGDQFRTIFAVPNRIRKHATFWYSFNPILTLPCIPHRSTTDKYEVRRRTPFDQYIALGSNTRQIDASISLLPSCLVSSSGRITVYT